MVDLKAIHTIWMHAQDPGSHPTSETWVQIVRGCDGPNRTWKLHVWILLVLSDLRLRITSNYSCYSTFSSPCKSGSRTHHKLGVRREQFRNFVQTDFTARGTWSSIIEYIIIVLDFENGFKLITTHTSGPKGTFCTFCFYFVFSAHHRNYRLVLSSKS